MSSLARRRELPLNLNAIDTRQKAPLRFFFSSSFLFSRMWIAGNERGPTQRRFSCSDSHFCTKLLLAAHYTGTVQPNQWAGLGLHCCHGEGIICIWGKKERKEKRRFLHSGPDFVPTRNAGYEQLFQLVTFKRPTKGMFLKSQLDQSLIKYRGGSKIASQCNTGKFKIPQNLFSSLKYVQKYRSLLKRENINLICLMFLILALMLQFPNAHRLNIATLSPLGNVDSAWKGFE